MLCLPGLTTGPSRKHEAGPFGPLALFPLHLFGSGREHGPLLDGTAGSRVPESLDPEHPYLAQIVLVGLVTMVSPPLVREKLPHCVHVYLFDFPWLPFFALVLSSSTPSLECKGWVKGLELAREACRFG